MNKSNKKTLESYESGVNEYIQHAPNKRGGVVENWIDKSLETLSKDAKILEVGSAYGRDAKIIEEKGFCVEKTDATEGFVEILKREDSNSRIFNILSDQIEDRYDLIIANAVFLHFTDEEVKNAAVKSYNALNLNGVLAITLKQGEGEAWQSNKGMAPRFFNFWSEEAITELFRQVGFDSVETWVDASDGSGTAWIMVIARKI